MSRLIEGKQRTQSMLFPERLEDWVAEENPVRAVDAFVDALDLAELGFDGVQPAATGRPACRPATPLTIDIHGYLNRIPSSRRPEREAQRNVELSRQIGLFSGAMVAIDGSKIKAVHKRAENFTPYKLQARRQQPKARIARYPDDLDRADRAPRHSTSGPRDAAEGEDRRGQEAHAQAADD